MNGGKAAGGSPDTRIGRFVGSASMDEVQVFGALWGADSVPFPLRAHHGNRSRADVEAAHQEIALRLESDPPRHLTEWARASISPDLRVEVELVPACGSRGEPIRINAVRRQQLGFVTVQRPPAADGRSGDVDVYATDAVDLGTAVVAALPSCPAGTLGDLAPPAGPAESDASWGGDGNVTSRAKLAADRVAYSGFAQVREGRYAEWRFDETAEVFFWTQYATYGRYVPGETLRSCSDTQLVNEINRRISVMVGRVREARGLV